MQEPAPVNDHADVVPALVDEIDQIPGASVLQPYALPDTTLLP